MKVDWQYCGEYYLKQWCELDRPLVLSFTSGPVTCEALRDLCSPTKYQVARTVPGNGAEKYRSFAQMLNQYSTTAMTRENVPRIIELELSNMKRIYGKAFLSAITKAFWMLKKHPVAIYDGNAWRGLSVRGFRPGYRGYATYFDAWFRFYDLPETQRGLNEVTENLSGSPTALNLVKSGKIATSEIYEIVQTDWFRNRITDIRLWHEGEPAKSNAATGCT